MKKDTVLFAVAFLLFGFQIAKGATTVYYGDYDDRMQYYDLANSTDATVTSNLAYYQELATGVCLITNSTSIGTSTVSGKTKLYLFGTLRQKVLKEQESSPVKVTCDDLHFGNAYVVNGGKGTGTLIADNKILTANHVFTELIANGAIICIFNYFKKKESDFPVQFEDAAKTIPYVLVNTSDVYVILETGTSSRKYRQENYASGLLAQWAKYDWTVLTLDRNAAATQKRMCYYSSNDAVSKIGIGYEEVCMWGHPKGLPLIFTDDAHGKSASAFLADLDVYAGNSGSAVFIKKTPSNSVYDRKIFGVVSSGFLDYDDKDGNVEGVACKCWSDVTVKPTSEISYIRISYIDDLYSATSLPYTNCSIPWTPPPPEPERKVKEITVSGEKPSIAFTPKSNGTYIVSMFYLGTTNNPYWKSAGVAGTANKRSTVATLFVPKGLSYDYQVTQQNGPVLTSGSGQAAGTTTGTITTTTAPVKATACVGSATDFPYKSIQSAIDNSPAGYTLHIARGVYKENIVITKSIQLIGEGYPTACVVSDPSTPCISIRANDVVISNLNLCNGGFTGIGISLENVTRITVNGNQLNGFSTPMTLAPGSTGNTVKDNFICGGNPSYGIELNAATANTISNNVVNYGFDVLNFVNCTVASNTVAGNLLTNIRKKNTSSVIPILNLLLD